MVCFAPPPFIPVYLCMNVGPRSATCRSACPTLCHSESGPLGLSVCECGTAGSANGQTACPVHPTIRQSWYPHSHTSPLRPSARLRPSYQSGCMFLFYLLGVGLPCHSIFCQFCLCEEAQCVYLRRHLGSLSLSFLKLSSIPLCKVTQVFLFTYLLMGTWAILPIATAWMDLESIMPSEIIQSEKDKYHMILLICGI